MPRRVRQHVSPQVRRRTARPAAGAVVVVLVAAVVASCVPRPPIPVDPDAPPPPAGDPLLPAPLDCARWRYEGRTAEHLPPEWDDDFRFSSTRDPGTAGSPHRLCGQVGPAVDLAWNVTTGRDDVLVAVVDSGIEWRNEAAMADLATRAHLNRGELPPPQPPGGTDPWDSNGDGVFDVTDYAEDPRVGDANDSGSLDPEDLILSEFSDGVDDDGNGWVDDISGWDLLNGDNNPLDDVRYGHGTGEARDSTALHDGTGDIGVCPGCRFLPVRAGDSFIAEGGRFAASVLFALDSGADVVQEALGAISNPPQAQAAIDAAYRRGVPVVASMADEQSEHANLPAALAHTIPVNSLTRAPGLLEDELAEITGRADTLAVNGCTNTGAIAWVAVPSNGCSSEATGRSAGMVALVESAARDAGVAPHPDLAGRWRPGDNVLSAEEVAQVLRATADDVDFSTPNAVDPPNEIIDDYGQRRFPTMRGWDATTGYGRVNAAEAVEAASGGDIPPEADITSPRRFELLPTAGTVEVRGRVAAVRSTSYSYRLEWAPGLQPPPHPGADNWTPVAAGAGVAPLEGILGRLDLATVAAALPDGATGPPVDATGRPDPDRFTVRLRLVVVDAEGRVGTTQQHVSVHDDPDRLAVSAPPGLGTSSAVFHDLDGDGADELVVAGDDGAVHALGPDGTEKPGFPLSMPRAPWWPQASPTAVEDGIRAPGTAVLVGAPAIADIDLDGTEEIVVAGTDGDVLVWSADGTPEARMRTNPQWSMQGNTGRHNRLLPGFLGSAALGDLDADGDLEVVAAAGDRHLYAWHHDGSDVAGFPVLLVDPATVESVDPVSHKVTFRTDAGAGIGGALVATPALGDLDGDGRPEIVVGAQEQYDEAIAVFPPIGIPGESGNTRLYAVSPDGTAAGGPDRSAAHPDDGAYLPGWPVALPMAMADVLPTIGDGVSAQAAIGDIDGDGANEVAAASVAGQLMALDGDATSPWVEWSGLPIGFGWLAAASPGTNSTDTAVTFVAFGGPALGDLGSRSGLDVAAPTVGAGRALDLLLPNDQSGDNQLTAWRGRTGEVLAGFPRATSDLAFFVTPALADVDGDGANEVVAGNGLHVLDAVRPGGATPPGWPRLTGGWLIGTPGLGDWDGDGRAELAVVRRDGPLLVWSTPTDADAPGDWVRFGGDSRNSGSAAGG